MADDLGLREHLVQQGEQIVQRDELLCGAIVLILRDFLFAICHLIFGICHLIIAICHLILAICYLIIDICKKHNFLLTVSPLSAYPQTVSVVAGNVAAFELNGSGVVERSVSADVEVITGIFAEAFLPMTRYQLVDGKVGAWPGVGAVQDDEVNLPARRAQFRMQQGRQFRS